MNNRNPSGQSTDLKGCINALRMLHGLPPHDVPSNICRNDGYFASSINRDYDVNTLLAAEKVVQEEQRQWNNARADFIRNRDK